jgi:hypothetical protein
MTFLQVLLFAKKSYACDDAKSGGAPPSRAAATPQSAATPRSRSNPAHRSSAAAAAAAAAVSRALVLRPRATRFASVLRGRAARAVMAGARAPCAAQRSALHRPARRDGRARAPCAAPRSALRAAVSRSRTLAVASPHTSRFAGGDMAAGRPARGGDGGSAVGAGAGGRGVG